MDESLRLGVNWGAVRARFSDRVRAKGIPGKAKGKGAREDSGPRWTRTVEPRRAAGWRQPWVDP
eukprot:4332823-Pyramimonas_sp.AAC.1